MEEKIIEQNHYKDEISLRELIEVIFDGKKMIAISMALFLLLGIAYAFISKPMYEAYINGTIYLPQTSETKYGTFTHPVLTIDDYMNIAKSEAVAKEVIKNLDLDMSVEELINSIEVSSISESNSFKLAVHNHNLETATEIANELVKVYELNVQIYNSRLATDYFLSQYSVNMNIYKVSIQKQESLIITYSEQLEETDQYILLQMLVTNNPTLAAKVAAERGLSLSRLSDTMMLQETINPVYTKLNDMVFSAEATMRELQVKLDQSEELYEELSTISDLIKMYYLDQNINSDDEALEIIPSNVSMQHLAIQNFNSLSPNKMNILAISIVLGLLVGIFVVFAKHYWNSTAIKEERNEDE